MDLITIDFETYYAKDYTLSKLTTEEYVRHDEFEVIGVGVKVNDGPTDFYSGSQVDKFLNGLDYSNAAILCHNTLFDGAILSWHYNIKPKFWFDTLSMARPNHNVTVGGSLKALAIYYKLGVKGTEVLDAKGKRKADFTARELKAYGAYCINDVELTYALYNKLKVGFPVAELMVIDQTIRMYTEPQIELDRPILINHLKDVKAKKQALLDKLGGSEQAKKTLMSNVMFAGLLEKLGVRPPMKTSPTTSKITFAFAKTDQGFLDLLDHSNPAVATVAEARLGVKSTIEETRTQRLIDASMRGPLPIMLHYYGAHTGRFSGGDKLNLQNLPARKGNTIRTALRAPDGKVLIACDSSQIEARMVGHLAGQDDLTQAFRDGRDVYSEFASDVYGRKVDRKLIAFDANGKEFNPDKTEGFVGKTSILGLGYGMGKDKFKDTLSTQGGVDIELSESQRIVYVYRNKYHKIPALWRVCDAALSDMVAGRSGMIGNLLSYDADGIVLPNGLKIRYIMLQSGYDGYEYVNNARTFRTALKQRVMQGQPTTIKYTKVYGGKVTENIVQALARIVISEQMVVIGRRYPVLFQVHDELIICVDEDKAEEAKAFMMSVMSTPPKWAPLLPVACEANIGLNYGECK